MRKSLILLILATLAVSACSHLPKPTAQNAQVQVGSEPMTRIFELIIAPEHLDEFHRLGKHNITQSVKTEQGVLAMYVLADKQMPNKLYVVEAYADENAYQAHRQTPHFQAWLNGSKDMIISRKMIDTLPIVFGSKQVLP